MATSTEQRVAPAAPPTKSWWQRYWKYVALFLFSVVLALAAVIAVVAVLIPGGKQDVSTPASAVQQPAAAPVSPADKLASAANPVAPVAAAPRAVKTPTFTPGTYTLEQVTQFSVAECQGDAAKAVVCYNTFVYQGDEERARAVLGHVDPAATRVITYARKAWQGLTEDGSKLVGFKVHSLNRYIDTWRVEPVGKGPLVPGKYSVTLDYLGDPKDAPWARVSTEEHDDLFLWGDGKWMNAPRVPN